MKTSLLVLLAGSLLAACASSEDDGGGSGGSAGTAGSAGAAGADAGTGGTGATGGSAGAGGGTGGTAGGAAGSGGSAGALVDAGPPVKVLGYTVGLQDPNPPVADFKVCVYGQPQVPCVMTNAIGYYELDGVPGNSELLIEFTKTSYLPVLRTITTATTTLDMGTIQYPTTAEATAFASLAGVTLDPAKGQVLATALKTVILSDGGTGFTGQDGVSVSMSPATGAGPFYASAGALPLPDPNLTATSTNGLALFANVDVGEVEVEMTHATLACTRYVEATWAGSTGTASRVPIVAGYLVGGAALQCPP